MVFFSTSYLTYFINLPLSFTPTHTRDNDIHSIPEVSFIKMFSVSCKNLTSVKGERNMNFESVNCHVGEAMKDSHSYEGQSQTLKLTLELGAPFLQCLTGSYPFPPKDD